MPKPSPATSSTPISAVEAALIETAAQQAQEATGAAICDQLEALPKLADVQVLISNEIVHLLSDQLYQSPPKALDELVVNSWDA